MAKVCLLLLVLLVSLNFACMTVSESDFAPTVKTTFSKSPKIPATEGNITVSSTTNYNSVVELTIKHLNRPEKILPTAKTYIVWEVPAGSNMLPQSIGILNIDKNLNGRLKTATPFRSFDIFITAEPKANQVRPSGEKLLWASVTR